MHPFKKQHAFLCNWCGKQSRMDCEQNGLLLVSLIGNTISCLISLSARRQSVGFFIALLEV